MKSEHGTVTANEEHGAAAGSRGTGRSPHTSPGAPLSAGPPGPMPRWRRGQVPRAGRGPNTVPCLAPVEEAARACVGSERGPLVMPSAEMVEKEAAEVFSISNGMFWSSSYPRRHAVCWRGRPRSLPPWAGPLTSKRGPRGQSTQSE